MPLAPTPRTREEEKFFYHFGLPLNPKLLARSSISTRIPRFKSGFQIRKSLKNVGDHPLPTQRYDDEMRQEYKLERNRCSSYRPWHGMIQRQLFFGFLLTQILHMGAIAACSLKNPTLLNGLVLSRKHTRRLFAVHSRILSEQAYDIGTFEQCRQGNPSYCT